MRGRPLLIGTVLAAATVGCDPRVYLDMRQTLPSPRDQACLEAALTSSPDVIEAGRSSKSSFTVSLRDSAAKEGRRWATVGFGQGSTGAATVELTLVWIGLQLPSAADEHAATAVGGRVLARLRAACAGPDSPATLTCRYSGDRPVRSCPPAA